jgi:hypothetical protein
MDMGSRPVSVTLEMGKHIGTADPRDLLLPGKCIEIVFVLPNGLRSIPTLTIL